MDFILTAMSENFIVSLLGACALLFVLSRTVTRAAGTISRERTRREVAAYIAEGTIRPEQGVRLLRAGMNSEPACP